MSRIESAEPHENRAVIRITGADRQRFLQNLVTNDVAEAGLTYTALLDPKGRFLADFFLLARNEEILLDVDATLAPGLSQRLNMYKLRSDVVLEATDIVPGRGLGAMPEGAYADPRHPALGWRTYDDAAPNATPSVNWDAIRVAHCIPAYPAELTPDTLILEAGFERLNGVNFKKGCYVGQEVTARMKHKTELRKGFVTVALEGAGVSGSDILSAEGKKVGQLHTVSGTHAIAYLRFDQAGGDMTAGEAKVTWER